MEELKKVRNNQLFTSNALSIAISQIISLTSSFLAISLTARYLGVEQFGKFNSLLAIVLILSKFVDFGFASVAFRESSKENGRYELLNVSITLRIFFFFLTIIFYNIIATFLKVSSSEILLSNLFFINIIISAKFQNIRELLDIPFKVKLKMYLPSIIAILDNILFLAFVVFIPASPDKLILIVIGYVFSNLPGFFLVLYFLKKKFGYHVEFTFVNSKWLVRESFPLLGYVIFLTIFQQADILLLRYLVSEHSTGIYSAAARLTLPFGIIPYALITTAIPIIVNNITKNNSNAKFVISLIYKILFFISFSISIICFFKAEEIIAIVYGYDYLQAATPMKILFWSQVLLYFNYFSVDLLTITYKQIYNFAYAFIIVIANILLIFLLVPNFSYVGASWAKFFSLMTGTIFFVIVIAKQKNIIENNFHVMRIVFWVASISISLYLLSFLQWYLYFIIGVVSIISLTLRVKYFSAYELEQIFKILNTEKWAKKFKII